MNNFTKLFNYYKSSQFPNFIGLKNDAELNVAINSSNERLLKSSKGEQYPVVKGIPRILENINNYANAFGDQWLLWRKTQLDSYTKTTISRDRLYRCLGKKILEKLLNSQPPLQVLEVGCGAGRFTEILLDFPTCQLTSMDLSIAVEANSINFPSNKNHRIVQADIMQAPFRPKQYDLVICLGVIQHTPNPENTIIKLYEQLKPGGDLVIDHYTLEIRRLTKITSNLLRPIIKRLPRRSRMQLIRKLVDFFFPIHKVIKNIPFLQQVFSRISPIITYLHAYPQLPEKIHKEWAMLDTHDGLTDWHKHLRSPKQIKSILKKIGANSIEVWRGGNGIESRSKRPKVTEVTK